uniref:Fibroblast growth factor n=1 Tax=Gadus morhua TaxID=8049 RepID=A0A8C4ZEA7_GADMO
MATGDITTLPATPDDGSGGFPAANFRDPKRLYCKNGGFFLRIKTNPHIRLQLQATSVGEVVIKGLAANRYLAMNRDGRLFGARRATDECYFLERLESNNYNTYRSKKYPEMYVALQRSGQYKTGTKTGPGQKAILFLPMASRS